MMSFAYQASGQVSRVAWQISSETCRYLKINLWGTLKASYQPGSVASADKHIAAHQHHSLSRLPVKPLESLVDDHPGLPLRGLVPEDAENTSAHGFVFNGIHYLGGCQTRHGPYPFCEELVLPSYSLAKSIFAGTYYLHLINGWPEFSESIVAELVPQCRLQDGRWDDVTMSDLINMTTGNYEESSHALDELADKMQAFFLAEAHEDKVRFACEAWPRKSSPGTTAVYHTTDDYLLGTAMNAWVRAQTSPETDIFSDFMFPKFLEPLKLSPLMSWTQRTYDQAAQPFTAYGLMMKPDDVVRIAHFLNYSYDEQGLLNQEGFDQAMFRDVNEQVRWFEGNGNAYKTGFWGTELSLQLGCEKETWVPFMSGYGGITVAMFPNGTIYYHFSDGNYFRFLPAALASHALRDMCNI